MSKSIVQQEKECWFCGAQTNLERHHIFAGTANRPISEKYGLWVYLCHKHHTSQEGAQYDKEKGLKLKQEAEKAFEALYGRDEWMKIIRKRYI